jgi:hypothetical protein
MNICVADAGGGTVEANCYRVIGITPFRIEELCTTTGKSYFIKSQWPLTM